MARTTMTLEIDPEHETLLRDDLAFLGEMTDFGATATVSGHGAVDVGRYRQVQAVSA